MNKRVSLLLCLCLLACGLVATGCKKAEPTKPKETPAPQNTGAGDANEAPDANKAPDAVPDAVPDANKAADALKGAGDANVIAPIVGDALKGKKPDVPKVDVPKID